VFKRQMSNVCHRAWERIGVFRETGTTKKCEKVKLMEKQKNITSTERAQPKKAGGAVVGSISWFVLWSVSLRRDS